MKGGSFNLLRTLRLQIKIGYVPKEPREFEFMKRFPPANRKIDPPVVKINAKKIPYLSLYNKIKSTNPILEDERVYPLYWEQEPQALSMAKKQYELMKFHGLSEYAALNEAQKYVSGLESSAYEQLKKLNEELDRDNSKTSFFSDANIGAFIEKWRSALESTDYDNLDLADQGEIDYFIQTEILKWKEVERERRMKDPVFVMHFEKLRDFLFPRIVNSRKSAFQKWRSSVETKEAFSDFAGVKRIRLRTSLPFYMDDYVYYFGKLKKQPDLTTWPKPDRDRLNRWIVDTLGIHEVLDQHRFPHPDRPAVAPKVYLDNIRAHFFPMVQYPDRAESFNLPKIEQMRSVLYANDVGYKTVDGKLYIRRFYLLPSLLFPEETLTTTILKDEEKLMNVMSIDGYLQGEMNKAGLREAPVKVLKEKLQQYMSLHPKSAVSSNSSRGRSSGADFSSLDALLNDSSYFDRPDSRKPRTFLPTDKQLKAWDALKENFDKLVEIASKQLTNQPEVAAVFRNYIYAQLDACEPSPSFYLDPNKELIFFTKFVDDVSSLVSIMEFCFDRPSTEAMSEQASAIYAKLSKGIVSESDLAILKASFEPLVCGKSEKVLNHLDEVVSFASNDESILEKVRHIITLGALLKPTSGDKIVKEVNELVSGKIGNAEPTVDSSFENDESSTENIDEYLYYLSSVDKSGEEKSPISEEEREKLLKKYDFIPENILEKDRDEYLRAMLGRVPEEASNEADFYILNQDRVDTQIIVRARFSREYERKEAARREKELQQRQRLKYSKKRTLRLL